MKHTFDGVAELVGDVARVLHGVGLVVVGLEKVEHTQAEQLERQAHVAVEVKVVQHEDA